MQLKWHFLIFLGLLMSLMTWYWISEELSANHIDFDDISSNIYTRSGQHEKDSSTTAFDKVTIRVNTYRRMQQLRMFLSYYDSCDAVEQVQIIWSDTENQPPYSWLDSYQKGKMIFEVHKNNSLTNRFKALIPINTEAVLSVDDDLIIPCNDVHDALSVWRSNRRAILGYTPRMHTADIYTGESKYLRWQHSWWNGAYSIMLTKAAYLHRDYLKDYETMIPPSMDSYIDQHRNCEDIAMAHVVAAKTNAAPVWMRGTVFEVSTGGISSASSHFIERSKCLDTLKQHTKLWPWIMGYQKFVKINLFDSVYWFDD